jgi:CRISPR/Cas system-associated exonuclease Cas4 (RecB family)
MMNLTRSKTFKHRSVELGYDDLISETKQSGNRSYTTPEGKSYPSITTILGYFTKASIMEWRKRVGTEEANRVSRHACNRGNALHHTVERYINNEEDYLKGETMPHILQLVGSAKGVLDERLDSVVLQECPLYSTLLRTAGRVDLIGEFDGKLSIVDFKTSNRRKTLDDIQDYFIQACTYAVMFEERTGTPVDQLVILMVVDGSSTPIVFVEDTDDWVEKMCDKIKTYHAQNPS